MDATTLRNEILKAAYAEWKRTGGFYCKVTSQSLAESLAVPPQDVFREVQLLNHQGLVTDLAGGQAFTPTAPGVAHARSSLRVDEGDPGAHPFRALPKPSLSREDVVGHLAGMQAKGWDVFADEGSFVIILDATNKLRVAPLDGGKCRVQHEASIGRSAVGATAENVDQLDKAIRQFTGKGPSPTDARTKHGEPASNHVRIARLIGTSKVEAVYDPYLDDKGLETLLALVRLSNAAAPDLRLITGREGVRRLSPKFATSVFSELQCPQGAIRQTASWHAHRRFMLLSGGKSLILGMSLNSIDKDEAVSVQNDIEDRPFFEGEWGSATSV